MVATMDPDQLKRFLVELPKRLHFDTTARVGVEVFKALYYSVTNNGESLRELYPNISDEEFKDLDSLKFPLETFYNGKVFYDTTIPTLAPYTHATHKVCAKTLKSSDTVYRCLDCGLDETCVICSHCFNPDEHKDHDVETYISNGNGGVCDCGDPEAFNHKLNCMCPTPINTSSIKFNNNAIYSTIQVCLDYILDVTNFSISTIPLVHDYLLKDGNTLTVETLSNYSSLPSGHYGGSKDDNSKLSWVLILWNDEYHDYIQATDSIKRVKKCSDSIAESVANDINDFGRGILYKSDSYKKLLKFQKLAEINGLVCTISSSRDYIREEIVKAVFLWLKKVLHTQSNQTFKELIYDNLTDILLQPGFKLSKTFPAEFTTLFTNSDRKASFDSGLLFDNQILNFGKCDIDPHFTANNFHDSCDDILISNHLLDDLQYSRLQLLLFFQIRFSKSVRPYLADLTLIPLVSDPAKKIILTNQFAQIYPNLITVEALTDREEKLNMLSEFTSQLFTCPASIQHMITNDQFKNIIGPLISIIENHSAVKNENTPYANFVQSDETKVRHEIERIKYTILKGIQVVSYFFEENFALDKMKILLNRNNFIMILLLFRIFQGHSAIIRKYGDHVVHETSDYFLLVKCSYPILKLSCSIGMIQAGSNVIKDAVELTINCLQLRELQYDKYGAVYHQVSVDPVSFVNPINSLLSFFFQSNEFSHFEDILCSRNHSFTNIADISLRSLVLGAQIRIGMWIRNGFSVSRQAALYLSPFLQDFTYFRDFHLNQVAAISDDPDLFLQNLISRWELQSWFYGKLPYDQTIYEDRFFAIAERFIVFIYRILVERSFFSSFSVEEILEFNTEKELTYSLCEGPKAYTKIKKAVGPEISGNEDFDKILNKIANYTPPTALVDLGTYRLKPEVLQNLDPLSLHLDAEEFITVHDSVVKCISEKKNSKESNVILKARIETIDIEYVDNNIGRFVKTIGFAKLVYKLLQVAIDTSNETYLFQLLHLIDSILVDDELIHGHDYICKKYVEIPICDLLLTIVESTMSKHIVSKADYLVERFITKDGKIVENLVECFGEDYMNSYKKRKTGLFETEADRSKRRAAERKAKVMKKFANQRQKFLSQNKDFEEDLDSSKSKDRSDNPGTHTCASCVLCGEIELVQNSLGVLASVTKSSTFWTLSTESASLQKAFTSWENAIEFKDARSMGYTYEKLPKLPKTARNENAVLTSCGHKIHYTCYKRSAGLLTRYHCPLCRNLCDFFLPTYIPPEFGEIAEPDYLNKDPIGVRHKDISFDTNEEKPLIVVKLLLHEDYLNIKGETLMRQSAILANLITKIPHNKYIPLKTDSGKYLNQLMNLNKILVDSIAQVEISTRVDIGKSFIDSIPGLTKTLLRALIQNRLMLYKNRSNKELLGSSNNLSRESKSFWTSEKWVGSVFTESVLLFFQTGESLSTLIRFGMAKLIAITIYSLLTRCKDSPEFSEAFTKTQVIQYSNPSRAVSNFIVQLVQKVEYPERDSSVDAETVAIHLYHYLKRIVRIYLRQVLIFKDLLTAKDEGENSYISLNLVANLQNTEDNDAHGYSKALEVPTIDDVLSNLASNVTGLESNIFKVTFEAKVHKHLESGILQIDYPGLVRLIDLPFDYKACVAVFGNHSFSVIHDDLLCLHCGAKVNCPIGLYHTTERPHPKHMQSCSKKTGLFFNPIKNVIKICIFVGQDSVVYEIPGPYLTIHGEPKTPGRKGSATLNTFRYAALNKMWLDLSLYGFVTRSISGTYPGDLIDNQLSDESTDESDGEFAFD